MKAGRFVVLSLALVFVVGGCRKKSTDPTALLLEAAAGGATAQVSGLLAQGADINTDGPDGTPLHLAIRFGHVAMVRKLVAAGADVNVVSFHVGVPPLVLALHHRTESMKLTKMLLEAGADPNGTGRSGRTVFHGLAWGGSLDFADLLLAYGARTSVKDRKGLTPLHEAVWADCPEMARWFLAHGADVNAADNGGDTPLHVAAFCGHREISGLLEAAGADMHAVNDLGQTPRDCVRLPDAPTMIELNVDGRNPYSVIMTDPDVVWRFLRAQGIEFDRIWTPARNDVEAVNLRAALERSDHIATKTWFDRDYILRYLDEYCREYAGFVDQGRRYILCNMDCRDHDFEPHARAFSAASEGGCSLARVIIDPGNNTVVRIDCN